MSEAMHWQFVIAAYAVTVIGLVGLIVYVVSRLRLWEKRARENA